MADDIRTFETGFERQEGQRPSRMDVIPAGPMRRRWSAEAKARIIASSFERRQHRRRHRQDRRQLACCTLGRAYALELAARSAADCPSRLIRGLLATLTFAWSARSFKCAVNHLMSCTPIAVECDNVSAVTAGRHQIGLYHAEGTHRFQASITFARIFR